MVAVPYLAADLIDSFMATGQLLVTWFPERELHRNLKEMPWEGRKTSLKAGYNPRVVTSDFSRQEASFPWACLRSGHTLQRRQISLKIIY